MVKVVDCKSIGDNFKITAFLFYVVNAKKSLFFAFFANLFKTKKAVILKLSPIDLALNFLLKERTFLLKG